MCFLLQPGWEGLFHNTPLESISYPTSQTTKQLSAEEANKKEQAQHTSFESVIISAIHWSVSNHISILLTVTWRRMQVILIGCMIFLSPFLDVIRMSMPGLSFLYQLHSWILWDLNDWSSFHVRFQYISTNLPSDLAWDTVVMSGQVLPAATWEC